MNQNMLKIIKWNKDRNQLKYSPKLEGSMLSEEAREFFEADTFIDRVDAYCDFQFVSVGTKAKLLNQTMYGIAEIRNVNKELSDYEEYFYQVTDLMNKVLEEEYESFKPKIPLGKFLNLSLKIVVDANEQKSKNKNAEGKVQKGENFVPPEQSIKALLSTCISGNTLQ